MLMRCVAALNLGACVHAPPASEGSGDRLLITQDEVEQSHGKDAYDVIRRVRAEFLSYRGATTISRTSSGYPTVYVDETRYGDFEILHSIPAIQISQIRMYRSWEATTEFGINNMGGVIHVTTKK